MSSPAPVIVPGLEGARSIGLSPDHACAVMVDGTVRCWGSNEHGQLGDGSTEQRTTPVVAQGLTDVVELSLDWTASSARRSDGSVYAWGEWYLTFASDTPQLAPVFGAASTIQFTQDTYAMGAGSRGRAALSDRLRIVENDDWVLHTTVEDQVFPVSSPMKKLSGHAVLLEDGTVYSLGGGIMGPYGNVIIPAGPIAGLGGVTDLAASSGFGCALVEGGLVYCWGYNHEGQLGDGTTVSRTAPAVVPGLSGIVRLAASSGAADHTCAVRDDGAVFCWGSNANHEVVGDGPAVRPSPVEVF